MELISRIGSRTRGFFTATGLYIELVLATFLRVPLLAKNPGISLYQMRIIGAQSVPMVLFTALFIGAETVIQVQFQFVGFVPLDYLGFVVSKGLINELIPVITAFVVSSRISTAIAAEIGNMRTSEQVDAMTALSLDTYRYIIAPRVIAAGIMVPLLVILAEFVAFIASIVMVHFFVDMNITTYIEGLQLFFSPKELFVGIGKSSLFGMIIAFSGAFYGLHCKHGAKGIGDATTFAVMLSALLILLTDFIVAIIFN